MMRLRFALGAVPSVLHFYKHPVQSDYSGAVSPSRKGVPSAVSSRSVPVSIPETRSVMPAILACRNKIALTDYNHLSSVRIHYQNERNAHFNLNEELRLLHEAIKAFDCAFVHPEFSGKVVRVAEKISKNVASGSMHQTGAISIGVYNDRNQSYDYYQPIPHPMNRRDVIMECFKKGAESIQLSESFTCYHGTTTLHSHSSTVMLSRDRAIQNEFEQKLDDYYSVFRISGH